MFGSDYPELFFACTIEDGMVRVSGEIDMNTAPTLYEALVTCAQEIGRLPTIDLSGVSYFDSSGAQALVEAGKMDPAGTGAANIVGVRPNVMRIMRMVGLDELFEIHSTGETEPEP